MCGVGVWGSLEIFGYGQVFHYLQWEGEVSVCKSVNVQSIFDSGKNKYIHQIIQHIQITNVTIISQIAG